MISTILNKVYTYTPNSIKNTASSTCSFLYKKAAIPAISNIAYYIIPLPKIAANYHSKESCKIMQVATNKIIKVIDDQANQAAEKTQQSLNVKNCQAFTSIIPDKEQTTINTIEEEIQNLGNNKKEVKKYLKNFLYPPLTTYITASWVYTMVLNKSYDDDGQINNMLMSFVENCQTDPTDKTKKTHKFSCKKLKEALNKQGIKLTFFQKFRLFFLPLTLPIYNFLTKNIINMVGKKLADVTLNSLFDNKILNNAKETYNNSQVNLLNLATFNVTSWLETFSNTEKKFNEHQQQTHTEYLHLQNLLEKYLNDRDTISLNNFKNDLKKNLLQYNYYSLIKRDFQKFQTKIKNHPKEKNKYIDNLIQKLNSYIPPKTIFKSDSSSKTISLQYQIEKLTNDLKNLKDNKTTISDIEKKILDRTYPKIDEIYGKLQQGLLFYQNKYSTENAEILQNSLIEYKNCINSRSNFYDFANETLIFESQSVKNQFLDNLAETIINKNYPKNLLSTVFPNFLKKASFLFLPINFILKILFKPISIYIENNIKTYLINQVKYWTPTTIDIIVKSCQSPEKNPKCKSIRATYNNFIVRMIKDYITPSIISVSNNKEPPIPCAAHESKEIAQTYENITTSIAHISEILKSRDELGDETNTLLNKILEASLKNLAPDLVVNSLNTYLHPDIFSEEVLKPLIDVGAESFIGRNSTEEEATKALNDSEISLKEELHKLASLITSETRKYFYESGEKLEGFNGLMHALLKKNEEPLQQHITPKIEEFLTSTIDLIQEEYLILGVIYAGLQTLTLKTTP